MSAEKRRMRAEGLVGQNFKYISKDEVFSTSWFTDKGPQAIERAMDECAIITNEELFVQHVMESADSSLTDTEEDLDVVEHLKAMRPTFKQLRNCINAKIPIKLAVRSRGRRPQGRGFGPRRFLYVPAQMAETQIINLPNEAGGNQLTT